MLRAWLGGQAPGIFMVQLRKVHCRSSSPTLIESSSGPVAPLVLPYQERAFSEFILVVTVLRCQCLPCQLSRRDLMTLIVYAAGVLKWSPYPFVWALSHPAKAAYMCKVLSTPCTVLFPVVACHTGVGEPCGGILQAAAVVGSRLLRNVGSRWRLRWDENDRVACPPSGTAHNKKACLHVHIPRTNSISDCFLVVCSRMSQGTPPQRCTAYLDCLLSIVTLLDREDGFLDFS